MGTVAIGVIFDNQNPKRLKQNQLIFTNLNKLPIAAIKPRPVIPSAISYADGGDGGGWIGPLINGVVSIVNTGINLGGTKIAANAATAQAQAQANAAVLQSGYGSTSASAQANQILYAALGAQANKQKEEKQAGVSQNVIVIGLVAVAAMLAAFFILKGE